MLTRLTMSQRIVVILHLPTNLTSVLYETSYRFLDLCHPNPCLNGGTCIGGMDSYNCTCATGFAGNNCTISNKYCNLNDY